MEERKPQVVSDGGTLRVNDVSAKDFAYWKRDPVTVSVMRYMQDYADTLKSMRNDRLDASGAEIHPHIEYENRGIITTLDQVTALDFEHMINFYGKPEGEEDEAKVAEY